MMAIDVGGRASEKFTEQFCLGGYFFGDGGFVEFAREGIYPQMAVGEKMSISIDKARRGSGSQRAMPALGEDDMQTDVEIGSILQQWNRIADMIFGDGHQAGGGDGTMEMGLDNSLASLATDTEIIGSDDHREGSGTGIIQEGLSG